MSFIYALIDPRTNEHFYIGCTDNLARRVKAHTSSAIRYDSKNKELRTRILAILDAGLALDVVILERCKYDDRYKRELFWITIGIEKEWPLCNHSSVWDIIKKKMNEDDPQEPS